jgi:hypothetical protein
MHIPDETFARIKALAEKTATQTLAVDAKDRSRAAITADYLLIEIVKAEDAARIEAERVGWLDDWKHPPHGGDRL